MKKVDLPTNWKLTEKSMKITKTEIEHTKTHRAKLLKM